MACVVLCHTSLQCGEGGNRDESEERKQVSDGQWREGLARGGQKDINHAQHNAHNA